MAGLPEQLAGQPARETDPESPLTAAWGSPAITVRCGVPEPATLGATSQLESVNDVDWFPEELTAGYLFTTYGRQTYVEVSVPDDYSPEVGPVTELSNLVTETIPESRSAESAALGERAPHEARHQVGVVDSGGTPHLGEQ